MKGRIKNLAVVGLLMATMFVMATPVQALQDLRITDYNNFILWSFTYGNYQSGAWYPYGSGYLLNYNWGGAQLDTYGGSKTPVYIGSWKAIKVRDGECVTFVNALANRNYKSSDDWERGRRVMDGGVIRGTLVATFTDPYTYNGHVAVFDSYYYVNGVLSGINVWDQNYLPDHGGVVARHYIRTLSTGVNNANNYYVVQGP